MQTKKLMYSRNQQKFKHKVDMRPREVPVGPPFRPLSWAPVSLQRVATQNFGWKPRTRSFFFLSFASSHRRRTACFSFNIIFVQFNQLIENEEKKARRRQTGTEKVARRRSRTTRERRKISFFCVHFAAVLTAAMKSQENVVLL
jgi:hypothetical protein